MDSAPRLTDDEHENKSIRDSESYRHNYDNGYDDYDDRSYRNSRYRDQDIQQEILDPEAMHKRWRNRRRMAWVSLIAMLTMTALVFFTDLVDTNRLEVLKEPLTWFYFSCVSIIGAYMGFTAWSSKVK